MTTKLPFDNLATLNGHCDLCAAWACVARVGRREVCRACYAPKRLGRPRSGKSPATCRASFRLTLEQRQWLDAEAKRHRVTVGEVLRELIGSEADRYGRP